MQNLFGIDLGGTKIEGAVLDAGGGFLTRKRIATPVGDYGQILKRLAEMIELLEKEAGQKAAEVGIGIPGVETSRGIKNANTTALNGRHLSKDLSQMIGKQIVTANDANCFTLSEATDGAARGTAAAFGVILGTGCGGGLVADGGRGPALLPGLNSIAGEWGHNPLPWRNNDDIPPPDCWCGQKDCLETMLSGPGLLRMHRTLHGLSYDAFGDVQSLAAAAQAAEVENTDNQAAQTLGYYCSVLSRGLASVINLFDPEVIVLGGGLSNLQLLYREVPRLWDRFIFSNEPVATRLVPNIHGDSGGVRGAAWLARRLL